MAFGHSKTSISETTRKNLNGISLRKERVNGRSHTTSIGAPEFPVIDLTFFEERELIVEDQLDLKALELLKTFIDTDETEPDAQLNDILKSMRQTDYYAVYRGLYEDGRLFVIIPVCYKTFEYGVGLAMWDQFERAKINKLDRRALYAFCKLISIRMGYSFDSYFEEDYEDEMLQERYMNAEDDEEREAIEFEIKLHKESSKLEKQVQNSRFPKKKSTYIKWIEASSFKKGLKKSFIKTWDVWVNLEQYGSREASEDGRLHPANTLTIMPFKELYDTSNAAFNQYAQEGVMDYVFEWEITCEKDFHDINYKDSQLENFFKWYDKLTKIL